MRYLLAFILMASLSSCWSLSNEPGIQENRNTPTPEAGNLQTNRSPGTSVQIESLTPANDREITEIDKLKDRDRRDAERVPERFRKIDFKNFSYTSMLTGKRFRLLNGEAKSDSRDHWSSGFSAVDYVDLTGDGEKEALVELWEQVVGGSTYGTYLYFIFALEHDRPKLLWKFDTGSESSCGHKSIAIEDQIITLEVFGICSLDRMSSSNYEGDLNAKNFTRFTFKWNRSRFAQQSREVLPYPENEVYKYLGKNTLKVLIEKELQ